ncbi:RHS repeat-associated core domain-containing protein [Myroides odoratus]|uniref:Type IV secretion protein Rhs n=1 Tax=Myroides odoratus TaxID=256 RepID=A0A9Q6Z310_MYROD|nr:RHS repeat-associated core domain-containing protein [Myroides odoratus]EHQ41278.1 RHS repeat-associated core domain-containing protein [Myroides odoratus DSM 2801]EKB02320.1 RHS repeat-associated core domain-containing protein [Myroides odoratus CIP 103059]EKB02340.1 RHS repeat-associated core domain-containing protein [Myroides odoratus CIP 103059]QQT98718.1 type IV secretion protein Rhs [Myroides odoratus]WQD59103.1 RHS repeat-associated core domain-containing protein [Myroides odoratus]
MRENSSYLTDINGVPTHYYGYLPFGELMVEHNNSNYDNVYKFNGKELDEQTGYYYYGARYYDPTMSIFLSVDPHAEKYPNINPYVYVANNPIMFIDPDGRDIRIYYTRARDTNGNAIHGSWVFNGENAASAPKNQFVRDFLDAYNYNVNNGGGDNMKSAAFDRSEMYDLTEQREAMGGSSFYPIDGRTVILWDPLHGLQVENGDVLSPATILEHEFDHANSYVNDTAGFIKRGRQTLHGYTDAEEKRVIMGSETKTARANGEISANKSQSRYSHEGNTRVPVVSPTSNKIRNTKDRSSGHSNQISKGLYNYERN